MEMKSGNPVLARDAFQGLPRTGEPMTLGGTVNRSAMLLALLMISAGWTWGQFSTTHNPATIAPYMWGGILGGLVSSTAVTLAMSRLSRVQPALKSGCVLAILLACGTMFPRVMGLTLLFNPAISAKLLLPVGVIMAIGLISGGIVWVRGGREGQADHHGHTPVNPLSMRAALGFALIYALVLLMARVAQHYLGSNGILLVAAASGISDVDPITLTVSHDPGLSAGVAAQAILIACAVNTFFKLGIALVLAPASARLWLLAGLLPMGLLSAAFILAV